MANSVTAPLKPVIVINKGIGGHTSSDGLKRFAHDVTALSPQHLVIYFGINDAVNSSSLVPVEQYEKNLVAMIQQARAAQINHIVLLTPHPIIESLMLQRHKKENYPFPESLNEHLLKYEAAVRSVAIAQGADVVDLGKLVRENGGIEPTRASIIRNSNNVGVADGVHFTAQGYRLMAQAVAEQFKDKIQAGQTVVCLGDSLTFGAAVKGSGTSIGETFPAYLNDELNLMIGAPAEARAFLAPRERMPNGNLLPNGDFEDTTDGKTPYQWLMWQAPRQYEGTLEWKTRAAPAGSHEVVVTATNPQRPAYLTGPRMKLPGKTPLTFTFSARGQGEVRLLLNQYGGVSGNQYVAYSPEAVAQQKWLAVTPQAQTFSITYTPQPDVTWLSAAFQVRGGSVALDDVFAQSVTTAPVAPPIATPANSYTLDNGQIRATFCSIEAGGGLIGIRHPSGLEFLKNNGSAPLWRIDLRRIPTVPVRVEAAAMTYISLDPEQDDGSSNEKQGSNDWIHLNSNKLRARETQVVAGPNRLQFIWRGIDVGDEAAVLDVTVTAQFEPKDRFVRFRTSLNNRSRLYTAFYVAAPLVNGVAPAGDTAQDELASPIFNGRLIRDPIRNGILGQARRFQPNRSGHSMQFDTYNRGGQGLYLGSFDGDHNAKRHELTASAAQGFGWATVHIPNNIKQTPQQWATPYDTVLTCFTGDWYDGSQIYREWALKQSWTAKGPLSTRKDIPAWFKNIDDWLMLDKKKPQELLDDPRYRKAIAGMDVGLWSANWGKDTELLSQDTPDRFPLTPQDDEYLKRARELKMPVMAYIQSLCWDVDAQSFKQNDAIEHSVRNYEGKPVGWNLSGISNKGARHVNIIAAPGAIWEDVLGGTIERMARSGMKGAYLDSFNHAGTYLNFNPRYARGESGGGNRYITSNQQMLENIRKRVRAIDPNFVFTAESFWEGNMAVLDAYLACNTTNQPLDGEKITAIPMAQAVYHDYALLYSAWVNRPDLEKNGGAAYFAKWGQIFVWGTKPAWDQLSLLLTYENHDAALADYERRLHAYHASKKFLVEGRMLRQPSVIGDRALSRNISWHISWTERSYDVTMPSVLHQAWRAPDGQTAVALYNISDQPQTLTVALTPRDHNVSAGTTLQPVWPVNPGAQVQWQNNQLLLTVPVPARAPVVVALR